MASKSNNPNKDTETGTGHEFVDPDHRNIWMRGLIMIIFAIFFAIAETLLVICAVVQFLWILSSKEANRAIAGFGTSLGKWLEQVTLFQTGASEKLPFPWTKWV